MTNGFFRRTQNGYPLSEAPRVGLPSCRAPAQALALTVAACITLTCCGWTPSDSDTKRAVEKYFDEPYISDIDKTYIFPTFEQQNLIDHLCRKTLGLDFSELGRAELQEVGRVVEIGSPKKEARQGIGDNNYYRVKVWPVKVELRLQCEQKRFEPSAGTYQMVRSAPITVVQEFELEYEAGRHNRGWYVSSDFWLSP